MLSMSVFCISLAQQDLLIARVGASNFFSSGLFSGISQDTFYVCLQSGILQILGLTSGNSPCSSPRFGVSGWAFLVVLVVVAWKSETVLTKILHFQ